MKNHIVCFCYLRRPEYSCNQIKKIDKETKEQKITNNSEK